MDPITHGIAGSLLGKSFFSKRNGRVAIFAATLGAVFPDIDTVADVVSRDPLALVKYHRGITHSFFGLPFFAAGLAWLTRRVGKKLGIETPSWAMLTLIYGIGILSHILMDGTTSFGTRMWTPFSQQRVAWDLIFIVDLAFTLILLVPQLVAWVYAKREKSRSRALLMWVVLTAGTAFGWAVARAAAFPFHAWIIALASAIFAAALFVPGMVGEGWGFRVTRAAWCRMGLCIALLYVCACGVAHHTAMQSIVTFANDHHVDAERIGALPLAPSILDWGVGIRSTDGVYEAQFDLRYAGNVPVVFTPDSPSNTYTKRALRLPSVKLFWGFSRFPTVRSHIENGDHMVDIGENRFMNQRRGPQPFTYRVVFDAAGHVIEEGLLTDGMLLRRMEPVHETAAQTAQR
ncbi:MAG TPA: metal-dependent hydrolase [Candidatus Acidoferrales bacterium]|nr:metal-dependent hydrolase [Candidatus Acidoferrales bacterium]